MFSTAQIEYVKSLVPTMRKNGYDYYIAYTDTVRDSSNPVDLYILFSKDEITANSLYSYSVPAGSVTYRLITNNASSSSSSNKDPRVSVSTFTGNSLNVDSFEHVYSNAKYSGYSLQPDITKGNEVQLNATLQACSIVVTCALLFSVFLSFFKR